MQTAFYLYTVLVLLVCVCAGTMSLAAYLICRKRSHLYVMAFFLFYFLDLVLIFQREYLGSGVPAEVLPYYAIDAPYLKLVLAAAALESLWLVACERLDKKSVALRVVPVVVYVIAEMATIVFMPEGPLRQWVYYDMRQVFLAWVVAYWLVTFRRLKGTDERSYLKRFLPLMVCAAIMVVVIVAEDTFVILMLRPDTSPTGDVVMLFLSGRNVSESLLAVYFGVFSIRTAGSLMRLRFNEPLVGDTDVRRQHIDELIPAYCAVHGLTARERGILTLMLEGKDNQNIASELHLALGTVKAHTHHILKKSGCTNRADLMREFWKE